MTDRPAAARWLVVSVPAPPRGEELLLVDALRRIGARVVDREGGRIVARLPSPDDPEALLREAEVAIRASTSLRAPGLAWRWEESEALAERWGREIAPLRVTERIIVAPAAADAPAGGGDLVVRLSAGYGFGTAAHPTTRLCLRLIESRVRQGDVVADVGTGSGILAIAAALLGASRVLALEADPVACRTARKNVSLNGAGERVEVRQVRAAADEPLEGAPFDGVTANLEAGLLIRLLPGLAAGMAASGWMVLSGVPRPEREEVLAAAAEAGLEVLEEEVEEGWWAGVLGRGS
jgi:ribosomal protein L11 methyltransferase